MGPALVLLGDAPGGGAPRVPPLPGRRRGPRIPVPGAPGVGSSGPSSSFSTQTHLLPPTGCEDSAVHARAALRSSSQTAERHRPRGGRVEGVPECSRLRDELRVGGAHTCVRVRAAQGRTGIWSRQTRRTGQRAGALELSAAQRAEQPPGLMTVGGSGGRLTALFTRTSTRRSTQMTTQTHGGVHGRARRGVHE